mmetsp:Transcript_11856/g.23511  ORF Transcript_11856/g.23511 Transcript_11856/m.23511 type:complete len:136 (+) Transcript_11856:366-773(+)
MKMTGITDQYHPLHDQRTALRSRPAYPMILILVVVELRPELPFFSVNPLCSGKHRYSPTANASKKKRVGDTHPAKNSLKPPSSYISLYPKGGKAPLKTKPQNAKKKPATKGTVSGEHIMGNNIDHATVNHANRRK